MSEAGATVLRLGDGLTTLTNGGAEVLQSDDEDKDCNQCTDCPRDHATCNNWCDGSAEHDRAECCKCFCDADDQRESGQPDSRLSHPRCYGVAISGVKLNNRVDDGSGDNPGGYYIIGTGPFSWSMCEDEEFGLGLSAKDVDWQRYDSNDVFIESGTTTISKTSHAECVIDCLDDAYGKVRATAAIALGTGGHFNPDTTNLVCGTGTDFTGGPGLLTAKCCKRGVSLAANLNPISDELCDQPGTLTTVIRCEKCSLADVSQCGGSGQAPGICLKKLEVEFEHDTGEVDESSNEIWELITFNMDKIDGCHWSGSSLEGRASAEIKTDPGPNGNGDFGCPDCECIDCEGDCPCPECEPFQGCKTFWKVRVQMDNDIDTTPLVDVGATCPPKDYQNPLGGKFRQVTVNQDVSCTP